ncbi:unnamed protein product [Rodentolepis nana]|uniref:Ephrin RBD domain-containing protein n=1 Tax=Rodentolepis nana TaxID=102285 RepID=A0A158QGS9_RODNA|nr:unnamed protein product [Rodentolepis nana]
MRWIIVKEVGYLLLFVHTLQRGLCYDYFQVDKNTSDDGSSDPSQYDCKPGMPLFNPPPCFAGDVRLNVVVKEGDTAQLRCYIYNVDFNKTYIRKHLGHMIYRFVLSSVFDVAEKPKTEVPKVDRSFWLVKDEAYNARKAETSKPVNSQPELKFTYYPMRSGPYIIPEKMHKPQNDERYQAEPFFSPTTTSKGSRNVIFMKYLLTPLIFGFAFLRIL